MAKSTHGKRFRSRSFGPEGKEGDKVVLLGVQSAVVPLAMSAAGWAVIGAVGGALVGSLAGSIGDAVIGWRREKKLAVSGARLVAVDISTGASAIASVAKDPQHRWISYTRFDDTNWNEYRGVLAARLGADDFDCVSEAVVTMREVFAGVVNAPNWPEQNWMEVPPDGLEALEDLRSRATDAYNALAHTAGIKPSDGLLHSDS
jgi:hypothetical protein